MKIRNGFVSNSSSSSFCILGIKLNDEQQDNVFKNKDIHTEYGISNLEGEFAGFYPYQMNENETLSQFKDRLVEAFKSEGIEIKKTDIEWWEDGGYNG